MDPARGAGPAYAMGMMTFGGLYVVAAYCSFNLFEALPGELLQGATQHVTLNSC